MATYTIGKIIENGVEREVRYSIEEHENSCDCPNTAPVAGDMCMVIGKDEPCGWGVVDEGGCPVTNPNETRAPQQCSSGCAVWCTWNDCGRVYGAAFCDRGWHIVGPLYRTRKRSKP